MKKLRILVMLIILAFSFSVKAEVLFEIDCNGNEITDTKKVTCEGNLLYETEGITDIEIKYNTNLDIKFNKVDGFKLTNSNGVIKIHTDTPLYDEIMNSTKIMEFTLSSNDKCNNKENITLKNIKVNNYNGVIDDVINNFTVSKSKEDKKSSICTLDSITVDKKLVKDFSKDKLEYKGIIVTNEVIFIDAVRTDEKSSASNLGNVRVPKGETIERDIIVEAEDGTKKIYKLFITNITQKEVQVTPTIEPEEKVLADEEKVKSNDNTLKTLELYNNKKKIAFSFDNKKNTYDINIEENVNKLTIKATLNDTKASFIKNYGPRDIKLEYGDNKVMVKVKAENGDEKTITLNINYVDNRDSDNTLSSLKINGEIVNLEDEKYQVKLPYENIKTVIEAVASSNKAKVNYADVTLNVGSNDVNITVTSETGEIKEYDVDVIREEEKVYLENIIVTGYNFTISKDINSYTLKIDKETSELDIKILPNNIDYEILNNKDLINGSVIEIKVYDSDGLHKYSITIEKDNNIFSIICYSVFGLGIVSLIGSIIYVNKKRDKSLNIEEI